MKKSLVALAALAAATGAFAQSSVTLSGIIKAGVAQTKYSGAATGNGSATGLADGSSRFILSGSEDLGGGLRANFQVDTRFRMDDNGAAPTSSPLAGGNTFIGLSGGFGNIQAGKLDTHYCFGADTHGTRSTALQAASCGVQGYVNGGGAAQSIANASRTQNVIRYTAPTMGGLSIQANYSTGFSGSEGAVGNAGKGNAQAVQASYAQGPLRAGASFWKAKNEDRTLSQDATTVMVGYDFKVVNVGLTYDQSAITTTAERKRNMWSVPVTAPLGKGTLVLTYTKADDVKTAGVSTANTGATLLSVGYDYAFSRRTSLGVSYAKMDNKSAAGYALYTQGALNGTPNNAVGQDASQMYVGLRHTF